MEKLFPMAIILVMLLSFPAVVYAAPEEVDEHEYGFCDHDHQGDKEFLISVTDIEDERELIEIYVENQGILWFFRIWSWLPLFIHLYKSNTTKNSLS